MTLRNLGWAMALAVTLIGQSCTRGPKADTPEGAVAKYVNTVFSADSVDDKAALRELSTGEALAYLDALSDEDFKKTFIDSKMEFVSMKTKDVRRENTGDVSLVYELSFREGGKEEGRVVHTNKKIAYLTQDPESKEWKIKASKNLKSFYERKDDLEVPPNPKE
jgi:hypothetical protein